MGKRVIILGGDGYLGWPTAMYLSNKGYTVAVIDNYLKRWLFQQLEIKPLKELPLLQERAEIWYNLTGQKIETQIGDITDYQFLKNFISRFKPDVIIHYGEIPSAPYSMLNQETAWQTIGNNLQATLNVMWAIKETNPDIHLVKLGTMGEYGTPNIDIEEGFIEIEKNGRQDRLPFPKQPGSFYHLSKVQDSDMLYLGVKIWGLRVTDLNQGPVYGIDTEESSLDREGRLDPAFHYDEFWGTVLNRFCAQAVAGVPLTIYGKGGQQRGFLNLIDTLQCVGLASENPAIKGEFRVLNQFAEIFSVLDLAYRVKNVGDAMGLKVEVKSYENPRKEEEEHYYNAKNTSLMELGLQPHLLTEKVIEGIIRKIEMSRENLRKNIMMPGKAKWV